MDEGNVTGIIKVVGIMTPRDIERGVPRQWVLRRMAVKVGEKLLPALSDPRPKRITFRGLEEKRVPAPVPDPSVVGQDVEFSMWLDVVLTRLEDAEVGDLVSLGVYVEPRKGPPRPEGEVMGRFEKKPYGWLRVE